MGALGLFVSALVRRTQTATVITFVLVLVLSIGTAVGFQFWQVAARSTTSSSGLLLTSRSNRAPEALLWLNPFVADLDMVCATAPDTYHVSCEYVSSVTGRPYFGSPTNTQTFPGVKGGIPVPVAPGPGGVVVNDVNVGVSSATGSCVIPDANGNCFDGSTITPANQALSFGFPRDTFWPKSAAAFLVLGVVLTLLAAQLVSPTRRLRISRPKFRRPQPPKTIEPDELVTVENAP
jgi:hypothetical protein